MKRTLTAAAVVASSAGAVGFAGTATAADFQDLSGESLDAAAKAVPQAADTLNAATQNVGAVVPLQQASRAGGVQLPINQLPVNNVTGKLDAHGVNDLLGQHAVPEVHPRAALGSLPVGGVAPAGVNLPADASTDAAWDLLPVAAKQPSGQFSWQSHSGDGQGDKGGHAGQSPQGRSGLGAPALQTRGDLLSAATNATGDLGQVAGQGAAMVDLPASHALMG